MHAVDQRQIYFNDSHPIYLNLDIEFKIENCVCLQVFCKNFSSIKLSDHFAEQTTRPSKRFAKKMIDFLKMFLFNFSVLFPIQY